MSKIYFYAKSCVLTVGVKQGLADKIKAATPAICGQAAEVPLNIL